MAAIEDKQTQHVPVMLAEALAGLGVQPEGRYLDGTFGRGGHARVLLQQLGPDGRLLLMDQDVEAITVAQNDFSSDPRVAIRHDNFARMDAWDIAAQGLDGILLDIGVSSPQLDQKERGFSFMADAPLDMRMNQQAGQTAAEFLAQADEATIANVLWRYGEERRSRRIARAIVARQKHQPLQRTGELADLVVAQLGYKEKGKHPATRTFQALRIHVNRELDALVDGLNAAVKCLRPGGRLVVISFHSLEDRLVKEFMRKESRKTISGPRHLPPPPEKPVRLRTIGKAQLASQSEIKSNPRARSAVLRVAERLGGEA